MTVDKSRPSVLILGTGFGSVGVLQNINTEKFNITVISPRDYFLFTPLLTSTTYGHLRDDSISFDFSYFLKDKSVHYIKDKVIKINQKSNKVIVSTGDTYDYDYLIIAVGTTTNTFSIPGVEEHAFFMRDLKNTQEIKRHVREVFCSIDRNTTKESLLQKLAFVVIGGGPTGVEVAGEFQDWFQGEVSKKYPKLMNYCSVTLIHNGPYLLNNFITETSKDLCYRTEQCLQNNNVNVELNTIVLKIIDDKQCLVKNTNTNRETILNYGTLIWCAGSEKTSLVKDLCKQLDKYQHETRGLNVDDKFTVLGTNNIYAIGDSIYSAELPPKASSAMKAGSYLAQEIFNKGFFGPEKKNYEPMKIKKRNGNLTYVTKGLTVVESGEIKDISFYYTLRRRYVYFSSLPTFKTKILLLANWLGLLCSKVFN
ncbi:uncharacterized protein SCDLUD_003050 [Saccharomycodes ludwigii]|uniref:uncharacterized protein n=1 Tax=Saccharomycodes ludwigii TaxID=36035 RepID=UPI001E82DF33|nr:hypothetical protein SCDLUD_003050 [Saccharomycodes ludwigii]KAH3901553.1 hypothetical protein SCDLUD_003050 [Saccharomycodes ludwigii]